MITQFKIYELKGYGKSRFVVNDLFKKLYGKAIGYVNWEYEKNGWILREFDSILTNLLVGKTIRYFCTECNEWHSGKVTKLSINRPTHSDSTAIEFHPTIFSASISDGEHSIDVADNIFIWEGDLIDIDDIVRKTKKNRIQKRFDL